MSNVSGKRQAAELGFIKQYMEEAGLPSQFINVSDQVPIPVVLTGLPKDRDNRERYLHFSFIPLSDDELNEISLLQIYTTVPVNVLQDAREDTGKLMLAINTQLAVGHFSMKEDGEVYYRYVHALRADEMMPKEAFLELVDLFLIMLNMFTELIQDVASGKLPLDDALDALN